MSRRERTFILLRGAATLLVAMGLGRFAFTALLPAMQADVGFSDADAGLMASLNLAAYLAGVFIAGRASPRGRVQLFHAGLVVAVLCIAGMALPLGLWFWDLLRAAAGLASGFLFVLATAFVFERGAATGPTGAALHFAGVGTGIATTGLAAQFIADWRLGWILLGLLAVVLAWPARKLPGESVRAAGTANAAPRLHWSPVFVLLLVAYALEGLGYIVTGTFLVAILRRLPETAPLAPLAWVLAGLAAIPSPLVWTRIAHRFGSWASLTAAYVVQAIGIFAALAGSPVAALLSAASYGFTFIGITGVSIALATRLQPGAAARATALVTIGYGIGQVIGPWAAGLVATGSSGFALPLIGAGTVVAISALLSAVGHVLATRAAAP
ncbi:MAG: YbfB/YjiJ family MFS transporter [Siculibacillus sp.]|nr:YbfB/YjiJ family MFS transporter [Siculibacillus sp.]